jgi:hypothetical protein
MGRQIEAQSGFTYLWVLIAVALIGVGLLAVGDLWAATQRARERAELIWVAEQFTQALDNYYEGSPGIVVKSFPLKVEELLEDRRLAVVRRHLRGELPPHHLSSQRLMLVRDNESRIVGIRIQKTSFEPKEAGQFLSKYARSSK